MLDFIILSFRKLLARQILHLKYNLKPVLTKLLPTSQIRPEKPFQQNIGGFKFICIK